MKALLKLEFRRFWNNKLVFVSLGIGCLLSLLQFFMIVYPNHGAILQKVYPVSLFAVWMGGEGYSVYGALYYMAAPLLIALPYNGSLKEDMKQGYLKNILVREQKFKYFLSKYIVCLCSALLAVLPLVLNFTLAGMICPGLIPQPNPSLFPVFSYGLWADLFYVHPYVYVLLYLLLDFFFWGLMSTLSLLASFFTEYAATAKLIPFLLQLLLHGAHILFPTTAASPSMFLRPSQPMVVSSGILLLEISVLILCAVVYFVLGMKEELYA